MTPIRFAAITGLAAATMLGIAGCTAQVAESPDPEEAAVAEDDLSQTAALMGAWVRKEGQIIGLVLGKEGSKKVFGGELQVWCIKAPCYPIRMEGTWTVYAHQLRLKQNGTTSAYAYTIASNVLTLKDPATHQVVARLSRAKGTWCAESSDCALQSYLHIMCAGRPICTAAQACGWTCSGAGGPRGYGDACGGIAGFQCSTGLTCDLPEPVYPDAMGVCRPAEPASGCDPMADKACGDSLVCVASSASEPGACKPFDHGQSVGHGYSCGGSIGVSCASGLTCKGLPNGMIGGTGTCEP
jgi:hypothetical protein